MVTMARMRMVIAVLGLLVGGCSGMAPDRAPVAGDCVLPVSGPVDCSAAFSVDDGRSAQPWQPCSYFGARCPPGDACRMGDETGVCAAAPAE